MGIVGMSIDLWLAFGLLAFSVAITLAANWVASRTGRPSLPRRTAVTLVLSLMLNLLWILLIFLAGVITSRYIERFEGAEVLGYLAFGLVAFLLSLAQALLYLRIERQMQGETRLDGRVLLRRTVHSLTYVLFAIVVYLILCWLLRRSVELILLIPLGLGALLPDLDTHDSLLGRLLPFISRRLEARLGHGQEWHTVAASAFVALISAPLIPLLGVQAWYLNFLGFTSHLFLDLLTPEGIMLFWPITRRRYSILGGLIKTPGDPAEGRFAAALAVMSVILLLTLDIGPQPSPPAPTPSFEQTVARYYSMRGNSLVFANVGGTWQATGRRMNGRFEILNAVGDSFLLLDRYSGKLFTAGRSANDHLYLNQISLQTGPSINVKPVEIHLQDQRLAEALPVVYEMQHEPGLEHIYVSGDVVLPTAGQIGKAHLQADYAQTSLRRIQAHEEGHYTFHYLTASDLIELANLQVEIADLVIVATYTSPAAASTVTPLPSPPPATEP